MSHSPIKAFWALVFILAIIVPALVLSFLSFRALEREEAYMEKQVEKFYLSEVRLQVSEINKRLVILQDELAEKVPLVSIDEMDTSLKNWSQGNPLIDLPFFISADKEILFPKISEDLNEKEISFLNWNRDFVKDKIAIPVYQNIALYYQEVVLSESEKLENQQSLASSRVIENNKLKEKALTEAAPLISQNDFSLSEKEESIVEAKNDSIEEGSQESPVIEIQPAVIHNEIQENPPQGLSLPKDTADVVKGEKPSSSEDEAEQKLSALDNSAKQNDALLSKSLSKEKSSRVVQEKQENPVSVERNLPIIKSADEKNAYDIASVAEDAIVSEAPVSKKREEQKAIEQFEKYEEVRNLVYDQAAEEGQTRLQRNVAPLKGGERLVTNRPESIFIAEPLNFTEIISKADVGMIPRFIEEQLKLLFWKKDGAGNITGCLLNNDNLVSYITESIKDPLDQQRLITILNEAGHPLLAPSEEGEIDWRIPFISREISEILPRWEVAVYLTNPTAISQKANNITFIMASMIILLVASILVGGAFFLRTFYSEMDLAAKKTTFVANVSHELKTPLTSIRMFAEMLKEKRQKNPAKQEHYLSLMVSETERLSRLVNNVLDFSKMNRGKGKYNLSPVNLTSLCEDILNRQRLRLETAGFNVLFSAPEKPIVRDIDPEALGQCLINLISNSEKYSNDTKEIQLMLQSTSNHDVIDILDRGIGVPKTKAKRIFKAFYRVDDSLTAKISGSGLGLSISQKIINDMGGKLEFIPRKGGGSVFRISFPHK
ncbi:MAG: HAMP domain-containing histidine kinase [Spirochaetales bacterium]|nr:HAMP domain-containing histidine kinase [Spirochaetales bacterium]